MTREKKKSEKKRFCFTCEMTKDAALLFMFHLMKPDHIFLHKPSMSIHESIASVIFMCQVLLSSHI